LTGYNGKPTQVKKHCSWLNQIECWFSIITRRLLGKKRRIPKITFSEIKLRLIYIAYRILIGELKNEIEKDDRQMLYELIFGNFD